MLSYFFITISNFTLGCKKGIDDFKNTFNSFMLSFTGIGNGFDIDILFIIKTKYIQINTNHQIGLYYFSNWYKLSFSRI
ncbi:MAG: hypothetical protein EAZ07_09370 [Cytophagales bacterium]|nr:MAG: hypothetical protein EAZ07_09370 [Cytophagales bacterium]